MIIGLSPDDWNKKRDRIARNLGTHWGDPTVKAKYLENGRLNFAHIFDQYAENQQNGGDVEEMPLKELRKLHGTTIRE